VTLGSVRMLVAEMWANQNDQSDIVGVDDTIARTLVETNLPRIDGTGATVAETGTTVMAPEAL
jgi:hypothetical protein